MSIKWPEIPVDFTGIGNNEYFNRGYKSAIEACKVAVAEDSRISPHKLFEMANEDAEKYLELMLAHGYLIPKNKIVWEEEREKDISIHGQHINKDG